MGTEKPVSAASTASVKSTFLYMSKIAIAIIGATGYTGLELLRLLSGHPKARVVAATSRQYAGKPLDEVFPSLAPWPLVCEPLNVSKLSKKIKLAFLCLPHHEAMNVAADFRKKGVKVIDLSADFRIKNSTVYETWYGPHTQKKLLAEAVYGLPELHREQIKKAKLVASPGCYATTNILALAPLLKNGMIDPQNIICDSKSGASGAGRAAQVDTLYSEVNDSFKAYKVANHRHTPEIEQELSLLAQSPVTLTFSPHLVPMDRGILTTVYCKPHRKWATSDVLKVYQKFYKQEKFVRILPEGQLPTTKNVRGTNNCHIGIVTDPRTERLIVIATLDNLTKGASGQALQSFNIMYGYNETMGLEQKALAP